MFDNHRNSLRFGLFYMLMKVHKSPIKGRPIISSINTVTHNASRYIDQKLQIILPYIPSYIQSSQHFISLLEANMLPLLPLDCIITCADVESLYPNIPTTSGLIMFKRAIHFHNNIHKWFTNNEIDFLVDLTQWVLTNNYFQFGETIYHQISGTAMGTPCAVVYACLFLDEYERGILSSLPYKPIIYKRYIDDVFAIFETIEQAKQFTDKN